VLELMRWSTKASDVLSKAVLEPVSLADRRGLESIAFLRVLVLACLRASKSGRLLEELAAEVLAGRQQLSQATIDLDSRITALQALARGKLARKDFKSRAARALIKMKGSYRELASSSCLVFGSLNMDLRAECVGSMPQMNGASGKGTYSQVWRPPVHSPV
jgi:hypothetical protein